MSVMWGLTGNMDPRLVSDGKALDVAYDAGEGNPKRTAEVTINGEWRGFFYELMVSFHVNGRHKNIIFMFWFIF